MATKNGQSDLMDKIKDSVTFLGGIGAISYAAGFIVVTSNLLHYGISDLNLLNAHYVSAGFLFIFLLGLTFSPSFYLMTYIIQRIEDMHGRRNNFQRIEDMHGRRHKKQIPILNDVLPFYLLELIALATAFVSVIVIEFLFTRTWMGQEALTLSSTLMFFSLLFRKWFAILLLAAFLLALVIRWKSDRNWLLVPSRVWLIGLIGVMVLLLLIAFNFYAFEIYPHISPAVGGGDAVDVRLVFDNESAIMMQQLVPLETNFTTVPLRLLDQSDKDYFLLVTDRGANASNVSFHAVQIDKSLIKGVNYYSYNISRLTES